MAVFTPSMENRNYNLPAGFFPTQSSAKFSGESENLGNAMRDHGRASAKPPPNLAGFRPGGRFDMVCAPPTVVVLGHNLSTHGTGCFRSGPRPAYQYHQPIKPAQTQIESVGQARAGFLLRRQNQKMVWIFPVPVQVPVPVWANRSDMGGSVRDFKGTGFFLPRVPLDNTKKKPSMQSKLKEATENKVVGKKEKAKKEKALEEEDQSEIHLPQEWTY